MPEDLKELIGDVINRGDDKMLDREIARLEGQHKSLKGARPK